ncbi:hypothetical protein FEM03_01380 [Phragmitibacter flavus]|uniref:Verru_Chthon cassette protein B n=1 Tax=Phragmitibacter flavus TaxID=2576071 RepID=A0A5R8KKA6_9BACT|nr:hypothetical protein [Phragmitibacter flavus]TLD72754.1 hypothetical protein FEM03_01380 [Phragmitibacter flavus]
MKLPLHTLKSRSSGATLVEVVITVGMLVTMLLPLIGMLSIAVKKSGEAINTSISSRISSQLVSEVQQANWATLDRWNDREVHFSDQGIQLKNQDVAQQSSYIARVLLDTTGVSDSTTPGVPVSSHEIRIIVLITSLGGSIGEKRLDDAALAIQNNTALPNQVQVSRALLVNMEKEI